MGKIILNTILVIIFLIMSLSLYNVLSARINEQKNISRLKSLYTSEEEANKQLSSDLSYYTSNDFIEKVSRDNLNLVNKGEYEVVLPEQSSTEKSGTSTEKVSQKPWYQGIVDFISHI